MGFGARPQADFDARPEKPQGAEFGEAQDSSASAARRKAMFARASSSGRPSASSCRKYVDAGCDHAGKFLRFSGARLVIGPPVGKKRCPVKPAPRRSAHGSRANLARHRRASGRSGRDARSDHGRNPHRARPRSNGAFCAREAKKGARSSARAPASRRSAMRSRSMPASAASRSCSARDSHAKTARGKCR